MKTFNKFIIEKLKLGKNTVINNNTIHDYDFKSTTVFIDQDEIVKFIIDMPFKEDRDKFIQLQGNDKHFWNLFGPIWILTDWFIKKGYTNEDELLYAAYSIGKEFNNKITMTEICWYNEDTDRFECFAISQRLKNNRTWHPELIKSKKYPFK